MAESKYPKENINLFNMPLQQLKNIVETQQEHNEKYVPIEPLKSTSNLSFRKLHTFAEVERELSEIRGSSPAEIDKKAQQVFARISKDFRENPEEMLRLIAAHPRTVRLTAPSLLTQDFLIKAVDRNYRVYDVLPPDARKDQEIINHYREGVKQNPTYIDLGFDRGDPVIAPVFNINPNCPMEKFATLDAYRQEVTDALLNRGVQSREWMRDYDSRINMGATTTMMALLRDSLPHLSKEFDRVEREVFEENKDAILKKADLKDRNMYIHNIYAFFEKHNLQAFQKEYEKAAWHNYCQDHTYHVPAPIIMERIANECPRDIAEQYFDMEKKELPATHPAMIKKEKWAVQLQQQFETDPGSIHPAQVLDAIRGGPLSVVKENFDIEACLKNMAQQAEMATAGELAYAPKYAPPTEKERMHYEYTVDHEQGKWQDFEKDLAKYPKYNKIYQDALAHFQTQRDSLTQEEKDLRIAQQWAFEHPRGSRHLDHIIIRCMQEKTPEQYQAHLDVQGYLERRAEWLVNTKNYGDVQKEATEFKDLIAQVPEAQQIVLSTLKSLGAREPEKLLETPTTKYAFSHDTTPSTNRIRDDKAPILEVEGPSIGDK